MLAFALALALVLAPARAPASAQDQAPAGAANAVAQDSAVNAQARALSSALRCPVCQGQSLQDSEAPLAGQMRELIRDKLRQGESPQQVRDY
ncbi:MAG TPA: cytochrome c-type biogenesis protein CcmH, partial [Longimicrobiales bacterium]